MKRTAWWAAAALLAVAGLSRAGEQPLPTAAEPAPAAPAATTTTTTPAAPTGTPTVGPAVPTPDCYPDWNGIAKRRHPLCLWLTYVPSRRPYFDGHVCQKAPNIHPPLYDYFPCAGAGCYSCGHYEVAPPAAKLRLCKKKCDAYCVPQ